MIPDVKALSHEQLEAIATLAFSTAEDWANADNGGRDAGEILDTHTESLAFHVPGYEPTVEEDESEDA